jgi:sugar lactone lactonase YvrE
VRYSPEGDIDFILPLPESQPTCAAFGGPDLTMLFITAAYQGMTPEVREAEPEAGNLFIFQTDIKGISDPVFMPELLPFSES